MQKNKVRINYLDIVKGLLIVCLFYGHYLLRTKEIGSIVCVEELNLLVAVYDTFFMQTFFIVSGYCSSFNADFREYLYKLLKSLLFPAIVLTLISSYLDDILLGRPITFNHIYEFQTWFNLGAPWFIVSLFWCKLIYWFVNKLNFKTQFVIVASAYIVGLILHNTNIIPNYNWHRHTLLLLPYLVIGVYARKKQLFNLIYNCKYACLCISVLVLERILNLYFVWPIPIHDFYISSMSYKTFPLHIFNVILGTVFVIYLSKRIDAAHHTIRDFFKTIGYGSLLAYLLNITIIDASIILIQSTLNATTFIGNLLVHFICYAFSLLITFLLIKLVYYHRALSWIVGR